MKILFDVEYQADSSYQLLLRLCGPSLELPGPVRRAPQRESHHQTHGLGDDPGQGPVGSGLGGVRGRRGPLGARGLDPPHAAPERGQRTRPSVDRQRTSQSFSDALPPTSRTVAPHPTEQNRDTWQTIGALDLLQRETEAGKIAVVPDNARPHHARALTGLHGPGRLLERIMPIHLSPYAPDHQPGRARPERGQERHRHHPARDPRRNPRRVRPTHHRPNTRPRLRTPSRPAKPETILLHDGHCFVTAMETILLHDNHT